MKVLTRCVNIENEEFVLISNKREDGVEYFGTIPYTEINEKGCMKRELNGFEMCISFESIGQALERRYDEIKTRGMDMYQIMNYFMSKEKAHESH